LKLLKLSFVYFLSGEKSPIERTKKDRRTKMNRTELDKYKAVLEAKQAELSRGLRNRDEIVIEKTPDALDEVQLAGERELAIRNLDREASLLRHVRGALSRIADGSYGICMHCEEEIKIKRIEAVPWAAFCIRCQEAADRNDFSPAETIDELLAHAA
jgi:DnaK suppressor protein